MRAVRLVRPCAAFITALVLIVAVVGKASAQAIVIVSLLCDVSANSGPTVAALQASEIACDAVSNTDLCAAAGAIETGTPCARAVSDLLVAGGQLAGPPVGVARSVPAEDLLITRENDVLAGLNANGVPFRPHTDILYTLEGDRGVTFVGCSLLGSTLISTFEQPERAVSDVDEACADVIVRGFDPSKKMQIVPVARRAPYSGTYFVESVVHQNAMPHPLAADSVVFTISTGID